jgi:hypothetical protein
MGTPLDGRMSIFFLGAASPDSWPGIALQPAATTAPENSLPHGYVIVKHLFLARQMWQDTNLHLRWWCAPVVLPS